MMKTGDAPKKWAIALETLLIFGVFFVYGAYTVPDVNEAHYLGKAASYWNPDYAPGDFFLDSPDAHAVFYFAFGWLTLFFPMNAVAWIGRVLTWGLLAVAWQRLSRAIVPQWGSALLSAAVLTCLMQYGSFAGEWVIGGVEAKGFAYVFLFFALGELARGRWNRAWVLLGFSAMFHVLVGGWGIVAAGLAWLILRSLDAPDAPRSVPTIVSMLPALVGAFLLSMVAVVPLLLLNTGATPEMVKTANRVLVTERLAHHLLLSKMKPELLIRFGAMIVVWNFFCSRPRYSDADMRLRVFVFGAVLIAIAGWIINLFIAVAPDTVLNLLRFYFYRLVDVMLPVGCSLLAVEICRNPVPVSAQLESKKEKKTKKGGKNTVGARGSRRNRPEQPGVRRMALAVLCVVSVYQVYMSAQRMMTPAAPRSCVKADQYWAWRDICEKAAENTPPGETFMVPYNTRTFTWFSRRNVVCVWKDMPQDAESFVEWWNRINFLYYGTQLGEYGEPKYGRIRKFEETPRERFPQIARRFGVRYVVGPRGAISDAFPVVYENDAFSIWQIHGDAAKWE